MILNRLLPPLKAIQAGIPKVKFLSTDVSKCEINLISAFNCLNIDKSKENVVSKSFTNLNFSPRSIINITPNLDRIRPPMMDLPLLPFIPSAPKRNIIRIEDIPLTNNAMECPTEIDVPEKQAVRLIVIRRRKMKKHQLKKLRKRMKFEWAKVRQRREMRKEKAFQAVLIARIKDAENFSAEAYVNEKFRQAYEPPIPRTWKGKRLPLFIMRQLIGLDPKINYRGY